MSESPKTTLGEIAYIGMGQSPESSSYNHENRGIPFLQGCAEFGKRSPETSVYCSSPVRVAPKGSVLMSVRAPVGEINLADKDYCIGRGICYILSRHYNIKYLYYYILNFKWKLDRVSQGSTFLAINSGDLKQFLIAIPSLSIQQSIADILTTIDNLIDHTESLIAKYQSIKQGMMHDLFTRGVDANGRLRPPREEAPELYKESALGWIPREWEVVQLSDIANVNRGKFTARPRNDPMYYGGQYPFIQTGDVTNNCGRVITHFSQTLSEPGKSVSRSFPPGTIAVTIAANIADTSILGIEMFFPDSIVGIEVNHEHSVRFIELCIRMNKPFLDAKAPQSAQKNINLNDLRPLLVPLPLPDEQHKISKIYETIECNSRTLEENMTKFQIMKSGLMHDLLTGTVRIPPHLTPAQEPPHAV